MDVSTLVVVFLLVTAASLASYLLSQWGSLRSSNTGIGWVAITIGTTLLLAAAAIVVLTASLLPKLQLSPTQSAQHMRKSTQAGSGTAERVLERQEATTEALSAGITAPTDQGVSPVADRSLAEGDSEHPSGMETTRSSSSPQVPVAPWDAKNSAAPLGAALVFMAADPWAATSCVYAFNPDPADLTRWTIDNECGAPVGIVFAACSERPTQCSDGQSTSWQYQSDGTILPGRAQRPVSQEQETQYGSQIRYVACMLASPLTIELIGQSSESRSSSSWQEQFDAARKLDECLMRVQKCQMQAAVRGSRSMFCSARTHRAEFARARAEPAPEGFEVELVKTAELAIGSRGGDDDVCSRCRARCNESGGRSIPIHGRERLIEVRSGIALEDV